MCTDHCEDQSTNVQKSKPPFLTTSQATKKALSTHSSYSLSSPGRSIQSLHKSPTVASCTVRQSFLSAFTTFPLAAGTAPSNVKLGSLNAFVTRTAPSHRRLASKHSRMPPKKAVKEEKIPLGRPGNNLKSGIVRSRPRALICSEARG